MHTVRICLSPVTTRFLKHYTPGTDGKDVCLPEPVGRTYIDFPILGALATAAPSLGQLMKHNGRFGKLPSEGKICFVLAQDEVREQWTIVVVVVVTGR